MHCVDLGESFHMSTSIYVYLLAKIDFDTAENEPCKVRPLSVNRSPRSDLGSWDEHQLEDAKRYQTDDRVPGGCERR